MAIADAISKLCSAVAEASTVQNLTAFAAAISVAIVLVLIQWTLNTLRPKNFPPGPPITPGLGNLLQMPLTKPYLTFHKWSKTYGDLVGVKVGTGNLVIINKSEIVTELFDRRGAFYSGRPPNHILTKHVFPLPEDKAVSILQYDTYYRRWRKSLNYMLSPSGVSRVMPILEAEAANFSRLCLDGGKNYGRNLNFWAIAGPLAITCGRRMDELPSDYTETYMAAQKALLDLFVPGAAPPVDVFPFLRYIPEWLGASWKATARKVHAMHLEDRMTYLDCGKSQRARIKTDPSSVGLPCLVAKILEDQEKNPAAPGFTDIELANLGASIGGAAVDTTAVTLKNMMLLFACYPEVMRKVQAEVDRVGNGKPPTAKQLDQLVYLRACIFETLRFRPTTPVALPHTLDKDDHFAGYFFPKGTVFLANAWTLNNNEEDYDRPEQWIPERFLDNAYGLRPERFAALAKAGSAKTSAQGPTSVDTPSTQPATLGSRRALYAFGSGRRICPGIDFAMTAMLLASSKILWAYDVLPPPGGVDISIETGYEDGILTAPKKPGVVLELRDEKRKEGLMEDYESTQAVARGLLP